MSTSRQEALGMIVVGLLGGGAIACQGSDDEGEAPMCADGAMVQEVTPAIAGCGGAVLYVDRATLCGSSAHVCTADEWVAGRGTTVPDNHYWTDDDSLGFAWSGDPATPEFTCWADAVGNPGVEACDENQPMRVCTPGDRGDMPQGTVASVDTFDNGCNWINCGLGAYPSTEYFGGCSGNETAGTLCCR